MNENEKFRLANFKYAFELVRQAHKYIQEKNFTKAILNYQTAINEYKQYLISLKYIEEDILHRIRELQRAVQRLKANLVIPKKEAEPPPEEPSTNEELKHQAEPEARRIIYQAKKTIDDLILEVKKGVDFVTLKQKVDQIYSDFKKQLAEVFGTDKETVRIYLHWLDNLINELQRTILERKTTEIQKPKETPPPEEKPAPPQPEKKPAKSGKMGEGYKILVVDDEPDVVLTLEFLLKNEGFTVFKASNGEDGIKSARQNRPDLIILDIKMPGISGYEAGQTIKEDPGLKKIPLIFLTAVSQVVDPTLGIKTEVVADRYVAKPYDIDNFLKIIKELLFKQTTS
jgi:CheY-like chemotaxis protein